MRGFASIFFISKKNAQRMFFKFAGKGRNKENKKNDHNNLELM